MGRFFENRKQAIFARSDWMGKTFSRIGKEIVIAVKNGGPDPDANPILRRVMHNARAVNMPKDRVEAAIQRALGGDSSDYEELIYEGYGPHGVPMLVVTATDNPTRTVANVRMHFGRGGGNLGSSGSVAFLFNHVGTVVVKAEGLDRDELELELIDAGLEDLEEDEAEDGTPTFVLHSSFSDFGSLHAAAEEMKLDIVSADPEYLPMNLTELSEEETDEVLALVARLEDDDDVQKVYHSLA